MPEEPSTINPESEMITDFLIFDAIKPAFDLCNKFDLYLKNENSDWNIKSKCNSLTLCLSIAYQELIQNFADDIDTYSILSTFNEVNAVFVVDETNQQLNPYDYLLLKNKLLGDMRRYMHALRESKYDHIWNITALRFFPPHNGKYFNYFDDALKIIITQEKLWIRNLLYNYLEFRSDIEYLNNYQD
jgi:hypothetical protein